ncbi:MAG: methionine biosynthesis protein MetW [Candidatus Omnitrophica bacterium]|nr:methionine biosynthesis protein MetW [Candidatus Omnitrophota bacterium]
MKKNIKLDNKIICDIIERESKVLDLGCGDGELLQLLTKEKNAQVQGIELSEKAIYKCVEKGVSVFHGDIESGLNGYPDKFFNYVILNQSLQETRNVEFVIKEALRVGERVIVGFPNFAFIQARFRIFFKGKVPITESLPFRWFDTPNLHFLSTTDFIDFCRVKNITILKKFYLGRGKAVKIMPNLFAHNAIFVITLRRMK